MNPSLRELVRSIQIADVVDVVLVAIFLFAAITWLRESSSRSAARRVMALGALYATVYLLAEFYALFLMERLLEVLFVVFLVALVVVFQADIRRLLDRLAAWSFTGRSAVSRPAWPVEILTETAAQMAEDRTGALIAIRGAESWDSYVQGGVELDGVVSRPLLFSIFQPDSPGHDGAVLMEGERVTHFAAHLPLATRLPEPSLYGGTRHAAALGLAESCDALVIVVSEERGAISVAQNGKLCEMSSAAELAERLERFWGEHFAEPAGGGGAWWSRRTLGSASLSLGMAVLAWLLFSYGGDTILRSYAVPVEFRNLPPEWVVSSDSVPQALVTLSGSEHVFGRMDPRQLVISFDLASPRRGTNELTITDEHLELPSGLRLHEVRPREVRVEANRLEPLALAVEPRTSGALPDSLVLRAEPERVTVLVPEDGTREPVQIQTEPISLAQIRTEGVVRARLLLPADVRLHPEQPTEVEVRLERRARPPARSAS